MVGGIYLKEEVVENIKSDNASQDGNLITAQII